MAFSPVQKQICEYECDNEGRFKSCPSKCKNPNKITDTTNHKFLIISKSEYNKQSQYVTGFPITSKNNTIMDNYPSAVWMIDPDLIDKAKPPFTRNTIEKGTKILCDRPCRLSRDCVLATSPDSFGEISDKGYKIIMKKFLMFCNVDGVSIID